MCCVGYMRVYEHARVNECVCISECVCMYVCMYEIMVNLYMKIPYVPRKFKRNTFVCGCVCMYAL